MYARLLQYQGLVQKCFTKFCQTSKNIIKALEALTDHIPSNFLNAVFHKTYLVHS